MKFTRLSSLLFITLLAAGVWSCGPSNKEENKDAAGFNDESALKDQIEGIIDNLPSPSEIPYLLESTGAEFNPTLVSDNQKADQFNKNDEIALNLGVYATDIGYLSSYEKTQQSINYLNACKGMADKLGVVGSFDPEILKKFEENIANKDSLAALLDQSVKKVQSYLKDDSRNRLAAMIVSGSFVEGLYISTGVIKTYPKDLLPDDKRNLVLTPLMRVILEQEKSVDELLKMLGTMEKGAPVDNMIADLTSLQASYRALNLEEKIKNNNANFILTDKNLADITAIAEKMRKDITH